MGEIYVVTSGKGGVGKTTSTANIGVGLSKMGYKTLLIDMDIGLRNLDILLGYENSVVYDISDVINRNCDLDQALLTDKRYNNLFLLPAAQTKHASDFKPYQIKELCENIKDLFDYIFIDCPAGIDNGFENAIICANNAIVIVTPEIAAIRDADKVIELIIDNGLKKYLLIINRMIPELVELQDMLSPSHIVEKLGIEPLGIVVDDIEVLKSGNRGEPVILNENSKSSLAYNNICKRIVGEKIPIMNIYENKGILNKIKRIFQ
jgi:septum site-determining protein MinD